MEWAKDQYNKQYDSWVPWLEDIYLRYFTRDNKASYSTRGAFVPFPATISPIPPSLPSVPPFPHNITIASNTKQDNKPLP
jgi:hypothetical protein